MLDRDSMRAIRAVASDTTDEDGLAPELARRRLAAGRFARGTDHATHADGPMCKRVYQRISSERRAGDDFEERYGFKLPSFLSGLGSILDLSGESSLAIAGGLYPDDDDPWHQDAEALAGDWHTVGEDLLRAARRVRK